MKTCKDEKTKAGRQKSKNGRVVDEVADALTMESTLTAIFSLSLCE